MLAFSGLENIELQDVFLRDPTPGFGQTVIELSIGIMCVVLF